MALLKASFILLKLLYCHSTNEGNEDSAATTQVEDWIIMVEVARRKKKEPCPSMAP